MEKTELTIRDTKAKKPANLLKDGLTPAVVYNAKTESKSVMLDSAVARKLVKNSTTATILDMSLDGKDIKAIIKEVDRNPVTGELRHIAFFEIDETKEMAFTIPFKITGMSPAVKNNLGVLIEVHNAIDVKCKVGDLVPFIEVDISTLAHPGQSISVSDVKIPEGITVNQDQADATIVTVTELQKEDVSKVEATEESAEEGEASAEEPAATEEASAE
ncbi:50S ribosomal protein L25 [bacterium]|nr:50S ribosomal protein L25 [bacterium]